MAEPFRTNMTEALQVFDFIDGSLERQRAIARLGGVATNPIIDSEALEWLFSTQQIQQHVNHALRAIGGLRFYFDDDEGRLPATLHQWHGPHESADGRHFWDTTIGPKQLPREIFSHTQLRLGIQEDMQLEQDSLGLDIDQAPHGPYL